MKVSVVIPVFNEENYITDCLQSLLDQIEKPDEIIVVDNGSTDRTMEIVKTFPVRLLHEKKRGIIPARNKGFSAATYEIIGRIDADTRVPKTWVGDLKKHFTKDLDIVAYSGSTIFEDKRFNRMFAFPEKMFIASFKKVLGGNLLYGPNMAIRKSAWEKVRLVTCLNDKLVHEDLDIAIHLHQLGLGKVVFNPAFTVRASERRWKKVMPYLEYPYRYLKTIQQHTKYLQPLQTDMAKRLLPSSTRHMAKRLVSSLRHPIKYFTQ